MEVFGFEIKRRTAAQSDINVDTDRTPSPITPEDPDGAINITPGGAYGQFVDLEGTAKTEGELVTKYREMALQPECDQAIEDIINEAVVMEENKDPVEIVLDDIPDEATQITDKVKDTIRKEFDRVVTLLNFKQQGYDIFRRWYVDGRMFYHVIIDIDDPAKGAIELRYIDPRKIRKVREIRKDRDKSSGVEVKKVVNEYYVFQDNGFQGRHYSGHISARGIKIAKDSIIYCTSGLIDQKSRTILSWLHKAIKPLNQLRWLEDAVVIYRIARAPERRIFYIDIGGLAPAKANEYVRDMMQRHKTKLVYDAGTGEVRDDRRHLAMLEDYWLPRRDGSRGTEISTLPGGQNLGEMDDVLYFEKKLYKALNVPISRLDSEGGFSLGRASEISRDEVKFSKFITRLRNRFSHLFMKSLRTQLILRKVITEEEWEIYLKDYLRFDFLDDNHFAELKATEIYRERIQTLNEIDPYVGKYYSKMYVRKNILMQTEDEMEQIDDEIQKELDSGEYEDDTEIADIRNPGGIEDDGEEDAPPPEPKKAETANDSNPKPKEDRKTSNSKNDGDGLKNKKRDGDDPVPSTSN